MEDLISVIVPVYNVEEYIEKCLDSIINQTYKNLQIIIVDDGSPDNSGKICDEYAKKDNRITVLHKENGGVSFARNIGLQNATGNWVTFVDSDDWIENDYIEQLLIIAKQDNADVVLCGYNRVNNTAGQEINATGGKDTFSQFEYLIKTLNPQTGFGFCHMKLIKKDRIQNLKFDENLVVGEDALFNMQLSKNIKNAVFYKKALYNYRNNSNSVVKRYDDNYAKKYLESMKKCKEYISNNYNDTNIIQNYYNYVAYHAMLVAVNYCFHPENKIKRKTQLLKEICNYDIFKEGILNSNFENISLTRKVTLFTLKHKLYFLTGLICKIRQRQNKKG